jgi:hypothetical protein
MTFIFREEHKTEYGEDDFQYLHEKEIQVSVKLDNEFIDLYTYEARIRNLSRQAIKTLLRDVSTNNRTTFLKEQEHNITACLNLFKVQDDYVFKKKCSFFWFDDSGIDLTPLPTIYCREAPYIILYDPFIKLQFHNLKDFKEEITQIFATGLRKEIIEKSKPKFLYPELWENSRQAMKPIITKFRKELVSARFITNKGNEAILNYFGLRSGNDRIRWEKGSCYFYTLNKLLEENHVLTGHYNRSLEKTVIIKDWNDWKGWHSLKPVKDNMLLLQIVKELKESLEDLKKQSLQTTPQTS